MLKDCKWFTRGWTLQELIAPEDMTFFGSEWDLIGTKFSLAGVIARITGIEESVLHLLAALKGCSVAAKMSWAAHRRTSRVEDIAYSLLGLFDVNMPMLYGEGNKAFRRLQENIVRQSTDQTIFAWQSTSDGCGSDLFAASPRDFALSGTVVVYREGDVGSSYQTSNRGLEIKLPLTRLEWSRGSSGGHRRVCRGGCLGI